MTCLITQSLCDSWASCLAITQQPFVRFQWIFAHGSRIAGRSMSHNFRKFKTADGRHIDKKLSCRREAARRCVSLNMLLPLNIIQSIMVPFESLLYGFLLAFYSNCGRFFIRSKIFSVKGWRDLENCVRSLSRSLKMAPIDRTHMIFCWSAIVILYVVALGISSTMHFFIPTISKR